MSEITRTETERYADSGSLAARLAELTEKYQPTQFAAVYDDDTHEWVLSYPNGVTERRVKAP